MQKIIFNVQGMSCGSCVNTVGKSVYKIEGIITVDVNVAEGLVTVEYDDSQATTDQMIKAIEQNGYAVVDTISK